VRHPQLRPDFDAAIAEVGLTETTRYDLDAVFEGYAGTSDSGFRAEVEAEQAMARGEVYMEMIDAHEHTDLQGPSAEEAATRLADFTERAHYQGKIALDKNRLLRIMKKNDPAIYPGEYITCVHNAATALCEKAKRSREEHLPDHGGCLPLACRNVALTTRNAQAWKREFDRIETRLAARPPQPPLQHAHLAGRRDEIAEFLALAARVGLGNTTFRRRFPEIADEIATHRRPPAHTPAPAGPSPYDTLVARNAKLRRSNRELTAQLKLAAAQIQYLAIRNDRLSRALEEHSAVTRLDTWSRHP
jgi:hypothetical protein